MMKKKNIFILLLLASTASACRDYVEVDPRNTRTLKYTSDFSLLMSNRTDWERSYQLPLFTGDDVDARGDALVDNKLVNEIANAYTWAADFYTIEQSDTFWDQAYNQIYVANEVIAGVMESENGTDSEKRRLLAEAQVQRAYAYLLLINLYAPLYNETTAQPDLGVPLLLSPDLFQDLTRETVQAVYNQVLADLEAALPNLPDQGANNVHPGKAAAYAILARTYLYMQRYQEAAEAAQQALSIQDDLIDLNDIQAGTAFPQRQANPEVILAKRTLTTIDLPLSESLLAKFTANDLRYQLYTRDGSSFQPALPDRASYRAKLYPSDYLSVGPSVPEMMLIAAEGLARNNEVTACLAFINSLREKRFTPTAYQPLLATDADAALRIVLDERRRELFGLGLRWFDQKRLNKETDFAETVTRSFKGTVYALEPNSNRYTYPIGLKYIDLNPELIQNPR